MLGVFHFLCAALPVPTVVSPDLFLLKPHIRVGRMEGSSLQLKYAAVRGPFYEHLSLPDAP